MKYDLVRNSIKTGDLLAWSSREVKSFHDFKLWLIRLFTRSEYVHVGVAWVVAGRVFVVESVDPYVRIVPLSNLLPAYLVRLGKHLTREAEEEMLKHVGTGRYSQLEAIKGFFNITKEDSNWQCAEFAKKIYTISGLNINVPPTPSNIVNEVQKIGYATLYLE